MSTEDKVREIIEIIWSGDYCDIRAECGECYDDRVDDAVESIMALIADEMQLGET